MIDTVSRLWAFDPTKHDAVVFALLKGDVPPPWLNNILAVYGLPRERVRVVEEVTTFSSLDFAPPGTTLVDGPHPWYLRWLKTLQLEPRPLPGKDLYIGRTHILGQGALMGESYFGALLQEAGFTYVQPENYDIHTQAAMMRDANRIVFSEGSGVYSIELLSESKATFYIIPRRRGAMKLFAPQIEKRAKLVLLGDADVSRAPIGGKMRPSSPSFARNPRSIHAAMADNELVSGSFEHATFKSVESNDYDRYLAIKGLVPQSCQT